MLSIEQIKEIFEEQMPYHKMLGLELNIENLEQPFIKLAMKEDLIGNPIQKILHGGAISSTLDVMGGVTAIFDLIRLDGELSEEKFSKLGTIDLRVDYLRPGRGKYFIATGSVLRTGNKIAVTRMELKNDEDMVIAVGTGTYLVG